VLDAFYEHDLGEIARSLDGKKVVPKPAARECYYDANDLRESERL
jgi:hypothetical protein